MVTVLILLAVATWQTDSATCQYHQWSEPLAIAQISTVRDAWLTLNGDRGHVVGNDIAWLDESPVGQRPLVAATLDGRTIGKPEGDFWFVRPRAVLDDAGTLHMVWAEPDSSPALVPARIWSSTRYALTKLWSAMYRPDSGWSSPTLILRTEGEPLWWRGDFADVLLDGTGHAVVAVAANMRFVLLIQGDHDWLAQRVPAQALAYTQVAMGDGERIYAAYVGPDPAGGASNSIMFIRSLDGGRTWLAPRTIFRAGTPAPQDVKLLVGRTDTLYVLWSGTLHGNIDRGAIHLATSPDGGATWDTRDTLSVRGEHLRAVVDRCGAVHVTYVATTLPEHATKASPREDVYNVSRRYELWYARWNGAWTIPRSPFPTLNCLAGDLRTTRDGDLFLMWPGRPVGIIGRDVPFRPFAAKLKIDHLPRSR